MLIDTSVTLPSGLVLPNRIVKAATSERLASQDGQPGEGLVRLYRRWGEGGAGALITGNVVVDRTAKEAPGNVVIDDDRFAAEMAAWCAAGHAHGARMIMQLSHAGRQSPRSVTRDPVAPSAVPMKGRLGMAAPPRALEDDEITEIIERFASAAVRARAAGFAGVQLHAAHGYLLSQFLSPLTNRRSDRWGGGIEQRMRLLLEVVRATRAAAGPGFSVWVKLNSADFQRGGFGEDDALVVAEALAGEGVDLIEVSGGNYESTAMFGRSSTRAREAYFMDFVERLRARVAVPLMLTGGFRSAAAMNRAIEGGAVDAVGLARPMIVEPDLPRRLRDGSAAAAAHDQIRARNHTLDDAIQGTWYARQLRRMAAGKDPDPGLGRWSSVLLEAPRAWGFNPLALLLPRPKPRARLAARRAVEPAA